jgi:Cd(II)/Pb(II)-responsive transcriptional regulator
VKIGALSKQTSCSIQTIRYYEREGLLAQTKRTQGNYRLYGKDALQRLTFIKQCRALDMSIQEVKQLIENRENPESSCASITDTIEEHLAEVSARIEDLTALKVTLLGMSSACDGEGKIKDCGVLKKLSE